jgi:molybdopterin-binding protein
MPASPTIGSARHSWFETWEIAMKLSARNVLKGRVVGIDKGQVTAIVRVDIGGGNIITSSVTLAAVNDLGLAKGSEVSAIIKASEVILGVA